MFDLVFPCYFSNLESTCLWWQESNWEVCYLHQACLFVVRLFLFFILSQRSFFYWFRISMLDWCWMMKCWYFFMYFFLVIVSCYAFLVWCLEVSLFIFYTIWFGFIALSLLSTFAIFHILVGWILCYSIWFLVYMRVWPIDFSNIYPAQYVRSMCCLNVF